MRARLFGIEPVPALLLLGGFGLFAIGIVDCLNFTVDDTFISFRFAENFAAGRGLVFNPGEQVEGYSNFLWTLILGALAKLGFTQSHGDLSLLVAAKLAALVCALGTLLVTAWLAARMASGLASSHSEVLWMPVLGLGSSYSFAVWTMSGMETALCAFLTTLGVALSMTALLRHDTGEDVSRTRLLAGGVVFGIAALVRPEQIVVWAFAMAGLVLWCPPRLRKPVALAALPTLAIYAIYLVWRREYYGSFV